MPIIARALLPVILLAAAAVNSLLMPPAIQEPRILVTEERQTPEGQVIKGVVDQERFEALLDNVLNQPGKIKKITVSYKTGTISAEYDHGEPVIDNPSGAHVIKTIHAWLQKYRKVR